MVRTQVSRQLAVAAAAQSRGFAEAAVATEQINFDELAKNVSAPRKSSVAVSKRLTLDPGVHIMARSRHVLGTAANGLLWQ